VERSPDSSFGAGVETFRVGVTNASLKSDATGSFHHRVRGVASCGTVGPPSASVSITIVDGAPVVIFTSQPPAYRQDRRRPTLFDGIRRQERRRKGLQRLPEPDRASLLRSIRLRGHPARSGAIQDVHPRLLQHHRRLAQHLSGPPHDPVNVGSAAEGLPLGARQPHRRAPPGEADPLGQQLADEALSPIFRTDFVSLQATNVSKDPPPVTVTVKNPRSTDMALAAETGPDGWLVPDSRWNETPLKPGETRSISLQARRTQGESGGIYPRYAFLTVRTKDGKSARVQVQDLDDSIPVYPITTTAATSGATRRQLLVDGLEQSIDSSRGSRTNVVLTEIAGKPGQVEVRLFEKGKERSGPIGSRIYSLAAYEKKQINNVFTDLGADQKDRTNVYADVTALPNSEGNTVALGTRIDSQTSDFKVLVKVGVRSGSERSTRRPRIRRTWTGGMRRGGEGRIGVGGESFPGANPGRA